MSLDSTYIAAVRTTTGRCADCPAPPSGGVDWLSSVLSLSVLPLLALVLMLGAVVLARNLLGAISTRTASVLGYVVAVPLVAAWLLGPDGSVFDIALGAGVTIGGVITFGRTYPVDAPREAFVHGAAVAASAGALGLAVSRGSINPITSIVPVLTPAAFIALLYPLGVALGHETPVRRRWVVGVGLSMATVLLWLMSTYVPFPGGIAVLLLPVVALLVVAMFVLGLPVLAIGAGSQDRSVP